MTLDASKIWRVAVIGCGAIGRIHIQAFREAGARVVAVSSRRLEHARQVASEVGEGCQFASDPEELVRRSEIDLVSITTSSGSHARIALAAIAAGKHVTVEKPLAMSPADARKVIDAAARAGVTLSVISQRRFEPALVATKRALDSGALGKLLLIEARCPYQRSQAYYDSADWRGTIAEDGGVLMNQAIHSVDLLLWFAGPAREVFGRIATQTHQMEAEDLALASLTFASGALGTVMATTSAQPGFAPTIDIYGERGTIKLENATPVEWTVPGVAPPAGGQAGTSFTGPALPGHEHHRSQLIDVLQALSTGRPPAVTGEDGFRAVELVDAVYRSARANAPILLTAH